MQHHIPYNNALQELTSSIETTKQDVAKAIEFKQKLVAENKPYAYMDIRINRQNYLLDNVETFIEASYNLIKELQEKLQEKNNTKLVEHYTQQATEQRTRICDMPMNRENEIVALLVDVLDEMHDLKTKYNLTPKEK